MKLKEFFYNRSRWTQGASAKTALGDRVNYTDPRASCFCLFAGAHKCYPENPSRITAKIAAEVGMGVIAWNDDPNRTFEDIQAVCIKLDI